MSVHRLTDTPKLVSSIYEIASLVRGVHHKSLLMHLFFEITALRGTQYSFVTLVAYNHHQTNLPDYSCD